MELFDNVQRKVGEDLKGVLKPRSKMSVAASVFSIYAFEALRKELSQIEELRFIFTSPQFIEEDLVKKSREFYIPHIVREAELCGGEFELRLRNQLNQRAIAEECAAWVKEKVRFKTNRNSMSSITNMIHVAGPDGEGAVYQNFGEFNAPGLGFSRKEGHPQFINKFDSSESEQFLKHFNQIWSNPDDLADVTERVQDYFLNAYKENAPEFIYFITLYNIFNDFLEEVSEDNLANEQIGLKDTVVWEKLYNFQKDAVIGAINKLEKYNGCILADSVGLGKTFSALGIIKYYEMRNKDVLVLCPKKLEDNWNTYRHNDKTNILAKDRFGYDVLFHTDLSRDRGKSNGRDLAKVNWGNYGLIVIDESHNFRNNNPSAERENRYQRLMRKVIREGIETKVLMLSATPVNNRFNDLRNQLSLAYEGEAASMDAKLDTKTGIDQIFRRAQQAFNAWSKFEAEARTTRSLLDLLDFDFFELLDALTIARSRKHITTYYDTSAIGRFPDRNAPVSIQSPLTSDGSVTYSHVAEQLTVLNLGIYSPTGYILPSKRPAYARLYDRDSGGSADNLTQSGREDSLRVLMRINLLKRMESSVDSFRITLEGIIGLIESTLKKIADGDLEEWKGVETMEARVQDESFDWESDWGDEEGVIGKKVKVALADMDVTRWKEDLGEDLAVLNGLWGKVVDIRGERDEKLQRLLRLVDEKLAHPINSGNAKVIVFTAFADTANYLYEHCGRHMTEVHQRNSSLITGSKKVSSDKAVVADLNVLLSCFSPRSKQRDMIYPHLTGKNIDLLIATDCISEGQNLQDCDYLINYDIHWNPVRIIQRFGRIDRIGSINESITMVNFWPDVTLDAYINLKSRVENKMLIGNLASTGDDNLLNTKEKDLEYRKIQLQKLQEEVIDLEDLREGVSITDLGLNDFRVDLLNYFKTFGKLKDIPVGLHAVVPSTEAAPPGVVFVLKNVNNEVNINKLNRLHPYYLVYMDNEGGIRMNHLDSKRILDVLRMLCKGRSEPLEELCEDMILDTSNYHDMEVYSDLLHGSIGSILNKEEEGSVKSLFKAGGTLGVDERFKGVEDFKLVAFLIVKEA